jgi:leucine-zipper-like transcriptional regulator 1
MKKLLFILCICFSITSCKKESDKETDNVVKFETQYPSTPELLSPSNGATGISLPFTLSWKTCTDPQGDPVTYDIEITANEDMTGIYDFTQNFNVTNYESFIDAHRDFYWRVTARDNHGNFSIGPIWHFDTY